MKILSPIRVTRLLIVLFFYGSVVGFTTREKEGFEKTWVDVAAGFGSLTQVVRDCNGNVINHDDYPFIEGGASIEYHYGYLKLVGKINTFQITRKTFNIQPSYGDSSADLFFASTGIGGAIGVNTPFIELDAGILYFNHLQPGFFIYEGSHVQPIWKVRLGFEESWYLSSSFCYNDLLLSQGGMIDFGFGFRISGTKSSLWFGLGEGPYSDDQFVLRAEIAPSIWNARLLFSGNIGFGDDGSTEFGLSAGLRVNLQ